MCLLIEWTTGIQSRRRYTKDKQPKWTFYWNENKNEKQKSKNADVTLCFMALICSYTYVFEGRWYSKWDADASASITLVWAFVFCLVSNECSNEYLNDCVIYTPFLIHSMSRFNVIETQPTTGFELLNS